MRIACLQYAPKLGAVEANTARVNELLDEYKEDVTDLDLLVLPELALTGKLHARLYFSTPQRR